MAATQYQIVITFINGDTLTVDGNRGGRKNWPPIECHKIRSIEVASYAMMQLYERQFGSYGVPIPRDPYRDGSTLYFGDMAKFIVANWRDY